MAGKAKRKLLIVDGYNVINARKDVFTGTLADTRDKLLSELMDYAGYSGQQIIRRVDVRPADAHHRSVRPR